MGKRPESLYTKDIANVSYKDVKHFCSAKIREGLRIDYKREFPQELEKTVASFANSAGGIILIGVETDEANRPSRVSGVNFVKGIEERVLNICHSNTHPPISPSVIVCPFPRSVRGDRLKCAVVVRVGESGEIHYIGKKHNVVYVREDSISQRADGKEVRNLWKKRNEGLKRARALIEQAVVADYDSDPKSDFLSLAPPPVTRQVIVIPSSVSRDIIHFTSEVDQFVRRHPRELRFGDGKPKQKGIEFSASVNSKLGEEGYFAEITSEGLILYRESSVRQRHCEISCTRLVIVLRKVLDYALGIYVYSEYSGSLIVRMDLLSVGGCNLGDGNLLWTSYESGENSVTIEKSIDCEQLVSKPDEIVEDMFMETARAFHRSMNRKEVHDLVRYYLSKC